ALHEFITKAIKKDLLRSAHDLSDGGLAVALAESSIAGGLGAKVTLDGGLLTELFSESQSRALVSIKVKDKEAFEKLAEHVKIEQIGIIAGQKLVINDKIGLGISKIKNAYDTSLEELVHK
ncbi:hypothetical protein LCGC14_1622760, partial [marine sediment metagenome]